jgi:hypothetical protein
MHDIIDNPNDIETAVPAVELDAASNVVDIGKTDANLNVGGLVTMDHQNADPITGVMPAATPLTPAPPRAQTARLLRALTGQNKAQYAHMDANPELEDEDYTPVVAHLVRPASRSEVTLRQRKSTAVVPAAALSGTTVSQSSGTFSKNSIAHVIKSQIVARSALLSPEEVMRHMIVPAQQIVGFPLLYPGNIISWSHIRMCVLDIGRSFYLRIMLFTSFFAVFCVFCIVYLFFMSFATKTKSWDSAAVCLHLLP